MQPVASIMKDFIWTFSMEMIYILNKRNIIISRTEISDILCLLQWPHDLKKNIF